MSPPPDAPRLLLVGGSGGLVGRAVLPEFAPRWRIRSVHRHPVAAERASGVEWVPTDIAEVADWTPWLDGVDAVLNLAWYRWESERVFRELEAGLERLLAACVAARVPRFLHVSVPAAPAALETGLPYLSYKRRFDAALAASGLSYRILRPTLLYAPGDRLLGVMMRLMERYHRFPIFGDGAYHVSPIAAADLARALCLEAEGTAVGTVDLGGPERLAYRELTDRLFAALGRPPRYFRMGRRSALFLTGWLVRTGSTLLYPYEVEWLLSDRLGLPAYTGLDRPLQRVETYLHEEARRIRGQV
jgi:uncharacterized protein YbjT (DUF2867 family)